MVDVAVFPGIGHKFIEFFQFLRSIHFLVSNFLLGGCVKLFLADQPVAVAVHFNKFLRHGRFCFGFAVSRLLSFYDDKD